MALRLFPKINRFCTQNLCKAFYAKQAAEPATTVQANSSKNDEPKKQGFTPLLRSATQGASQRLDSEAKLLQKKSQLQQLQPALLPKYFKSPVNIDNGIFPKTPESQTGRLEQSLTHRNVKLPLKKPKLSNPFPDPVKAMPSDTMSDSEKAEQMQASARVPTGTDTRLSSPGPSGFSQCRSYSTKAGCGKKGSKNKKSKCTKIKMDKCKPRRRQSCRVEYPRFEILTEAVAPLINIEIADPSSLSTSDRNKSYNRHQPMRCSKKKGGKSKKKDGKDKKGKKPSGKGKKKKTSGRKTDSSESWVTVADRTSVQHFPSLLKNQTTEIKDLKIMDVNSNMLYKGKKCLTKEGQTNVKKLDKAEDSEKVIPVNSSKSWVAIANPVSVLDFPVLLHTDTAVPTGQKITGEECSILSTGETFEKTGEEAINSFSRKTSFNLDIKIPLDSSESWITVEDSNLEATSMFLYGKKKGKAKNKKKGNSKDKKKKGKSKMKKGSKKDKCKKIPFPGCKEKKKKEKPKKCPEPKKRKIKDCPPVKKCAPVPVSPFPHWLNEEEIENPCPFVYIFKKKKDKASKHCPEVDLSICEDETKKDRCSIQRKGVTKKCPTDLLSKKRRKPSKPKKKSSEFPGMPSALQSLNSAENIKTRT